MLLGFFKIWLTKLMHVDMRICCNSCSNIKKRLIRVKSIIIINN